MKKQTYSILIGIFLLAGLVSCGGSYELEGDEILAPEGQTEVLKFPINVAEKYSVYLDEPKWEDVTREAIADWNRALGAERFTMEEGFKPVYIGHPDETYTEHCEEDPSGGCTASTAYECDVQIKDPAFIKHELGHCAGFGHSTDKESVMYGGERASQEYFSQELETEFNAALSAQTQGRENSKISYRK